MISYSRRLSKFSNIISRCQFSFSLNKERVEYHKAVLASNVIELIMNSKIFGTPESDGSYPSLRSLCLNKINNYNPGVNIKADPNKNTEGQNSTEDVRAKTDKKVEPKEEPKGSAEVEEARKFLLAYFIEGVWIHNMHCPQTRFGTDLTTKKKIKSSGEPLQDYFECPNQEQFKKVVFCPSHMITTQMFNALKPSQYSEGRFLLYGQPGIGKTYAFVLYRSLSEIVLRYKHNYLKESEKQKDFKFQIPKLVYISLDPKNSQIVQKFDEKEINKTIISQCFLESESFNEKDFEKDFFEILRNQVVLHKKRDNQVVVVVDQINSVAALQRQNDEIEAKLTTLKNEVAKLTDSDEDKKKKTQLEQQILAQKIQLGLKKQLFSKFYSLIEKLRKSNGRVIYLSSIDIEQHLLTKLNLIGDSNHNQISMFHIEYENFWKKPSVISDNIELIMTILEAKVIDLKKLIPNNSENSHKMTDIETESLDKIKQQLKLGFQNLPVTLLSIGRALNKAIKENLKPSKIEQSMSRFNNETNLVKFLIQRFLCQKEEHFVEKLINLIFEEYKNILMKKIKQFLNSQKQPGKIQQKSKILLRLLYEAKAKRKEQKNNPSVSDSLLAVKLNLYPRQFDPLLTRKLFSFNKHKKSYVLNIPIQMLENISDELQEELIDNLSGNILDIFNLFDAPTLKGLMIESTLRHVLAEENSCLQYESSLKKFRLLFRMQNQMRFFEPIPTISEKKYLTYDFLNSFYQKINEADKNQSSADYFYEPGKKVKSEQNNQIQYIHKTVFNSKQIDFILCHRAPKNFNIHAYDVTITSDQKQITDKVMSFLFDYSNFKDNFFKDESAPQISYEPQIFYNVIVFTKEKLKINWQKTFQAEIKRLQLKIEELTNNKKESSSSTTIEKTNKPEKDIDIKKSKRKKTSQVLQQKITQTIKKINEYQTFLKNQIEQQQKLFDEQNKNQQKLRDDENKNKKNQSKKLPKDSPQTIKIKNILKSLKNKEEEFKKYSNPFLLLAKLKITQIRHSNSFVIDKIESGSGSASTQKQNKIIFYGVEIIPYIQKIKVYNQKTKVKRIETYLKLLQMFTKQVMGQQIK